MKKAPLFQNTSSSMQFFGFLFLAVVVTLITLIIGAIIAYGIWGNLILDYLFHNIYDLSSPESVNMLKFMQVISQLGLMVFPALIFAFFINRNVTEYLDLDKSPKLITAVLSIILIFVASPLVNWMIEINANMKLPESLSNIETWMRNSEDLGAELSNAFLLNGSISALIINLLMIGVIAAVGEEFLFRGVIQKIFAQWFKNIHIAVIVAAIFFSAFHMQFYGFFPRFMMGLLLGYLYVWTGSLWIPIIVHFVNNASAIVVAFLFSRGIIETNYEEFGSFDGVFPVVLSSILVASLLFVIYRKEKIIIV
ncbi:MAG: CPBP family intramembrane metalloprotease [Saprospiraceae bacterium]|nr:CPBP family intramembrane metalloprotease [Saprospiraceae bacterium]